MNTQPNQDAVNESRLFETRADPSTPSELGDEIIGASTPLASKAVEPLLIIIDPDPPPLLGLFIPGTPGDDFLVGGAGQDTLIGYAGDDNLLGLGGRDSIDGGEGNDFLMGGDGPDTLIGGVGRDTLQGDAGDDTLSGGDGFDAAQYDFSATASPLVFDVSAFSAGAAMGLGDGQGGTDWLEGIESLQVFGSSTDDHVTGSAADDFLVGMSGNDTLLGNAGVDVLTGDDGNDSLLGGAGNDYLTGGRGNDTLIGGDGDDTAWYAFGDEAHGIEFDGSPFSAGATMDLDDGQGGTDHLESMELLLVYGSNFEDSLIGSAGPDSFYGYAGSDKLFGNAGADELYGDEGDDSLSGGAGDDRLDGGAGNDTLDGGEGNDVLDGGTGNDRYLVDNVLDVVVETSTVPTEIDIVVASVSVGLSANVENLTLTGSALNGAGNALANNIAGNALANSLSGGGGNDTLNGLDGNDTLDGGPGIDRLVGGLGNDRYIVDSAGDVVLETSNSPTEIDTVVASSNFGIPANVENVILTGTARSVGGNALGNHITGNDVDNGLSGGGGNDTLLGGAGNDTLEGGTGNDSMVGGAGNDRYFVDSALDIVVESGLDPTDIDTIVASVSVGLPANVENLTLTGSALNGSGNALANNLTGNALGNSLSGGGGNDTLNGLEGDDTLDGGPGIDRLVGGLGNDRYIVDSAGDVVVETSTDPTEIDTVVASSNFGIPANVENVILSGTARSVGGNALGNHITGNDVANGLAGGGGNDTLLGGAGNDTLDGGTGNDSMVGGAGNDRYLVDSALDIVVESGLDPTDIDTIVASVSYGLPANVENLTLTGSALNGAGNALANNIAGNALANSLSGGGGNDTLNGLEGDDTLDGGPGIDRLVGGAGNDRYLVDSAGDVVVETSTLATEIDTVVASANFSIPANVENALLTGSARSVGGNALANHITGNALDNSLGGGAGDDTLLGGDGDDTLDGGSGNDWMAGGTGNDLYFVDQAGDTVTEGADQGHDLVRSSVSHVLVANVEDLMLLGTASIDGAGNDLYNTLFANTGDNVLDGGAGVDTVCYEFGAGAGVTLSLALAVPQATGGSGIDTLLNLENLTGSSYADTLSGNSDANVLDGGADDDVLDGLGGSDTVLGGQGADLGIYLASENAGESNLYDGGTGHDTLRLKFTLAELASAAVQADIGAFTAFLATHGNPASDGGPQFQFTAFDLTASNWEALDLVATDGVVWQRAAAPVTFGTLAAPTTFTIGTTFNPIAGDRWAGAVPDGSDNWSVPDNWLDTTAPTATDRVMFDAADAGGLSRVDAAFSGTIAGWVDTGQAGHTQEFERALQVTGAVNLHTVNAAQAAALTVFDTQVNLHLTAFDVGRNDRGSGSATGYLLLNAGAHLDAADVDAVRVAFSNGGAARGALILSGDASLDLGGTVSIGRTDSLTSGAADGALLLGNNASLRVGTADALASLDIGHNLTLGRYGGKGSAVGVLDALQTGADVELHLSHLAVGNSSGAGTADGTLKWNQTEPIDASNVYFGRGGGAVGRLEVPAGGTLNLGTAADPVRALYIAYDSTGGAQTTANLDFTVTDPDFTAYVGQQLTIGSTVSLENGSADGRLVLGSNSRLRVGTVDALATLSIGKNTTSSAYGGKGAPVGVFDALQTAADVELHLGDFSVGDSSGNGTADGTLKWNQTEVIDASYVYFGVGAGAVGRLEVPAGGTLNLGTAADPVSWLYIAYNNTGVAQQATADLDFTVTDPNFTAYVLRTLSIGRTGSSGPADGKLELGSNSRLRVGAVGDLATLDIGYSGGPGAAIGVLGVSSAATDLELHLDALTVGTSPGSGASLGMFFAGSGVHGTATTIKVGTGVAATGILDIHGASLDATALNFASGKVDFHDSTLTVGSTGSLSTNTLNHSGGLLTGHGLAITDGTLNFTGGALAVDTVTGNLTQRGGRLLPSLGAGETTVDGNYALASAGTLRVDLFGSSFAAGHTQYDRLNVNGTVNLNADGGTGGALEVHLGCSPTVGTAFTILSNDGVDAIVGRFAGLMNDASFDVGYGSQTVTFQISYASGTGNDIVLTTTAVSGAAPSGLTVTGTAGHDVLGGSVGDDTLTGGAGNDVLTGSDGADQFRFVTTGEGVDTISDFACGIDKIQVVAANFGLVPGGSANLVVDGSPGSNAAAFVYDSQTGILAFDADGNGVGAALTLATLANKPPTLLPADVVLGA
jgi:Ca2+-binding RTX toxin-like protein